ncbi:uncharacterized protein LOC111901566 [Lactuca sativa]|uniref:uncharacterized protein LOC111901566 n=1 Tax=Lactuca sativa TaxID=4236 RepID=UPI000CD8A0B0|nr:uncharacterized protein LOC111901566 [Lactuca sativa]
MTCRIISPPRVSNRNWSMREIAYGGYRVLSYTFIAFTSSHSLKSEPFPNPNQISRLPPQLHREMSTAISSPTAYSRVPSNSQIVRNSNSSVSASLCLKFTNNRHGKGAVGMLLQKKLVLPRHRFRCNCNSSTPGGPVPGENESKQVLDAFFLGKALAEALNERVESAVGELLSTVGRLQAEQQKQVQEFQDEVVERAKKAKVKAAREAMEAQGIVPKSPASSVSSPIVIIDEVTISPSSSSSDSKDEGPSKDSTDPLLGISIDD